MSAEVFSWNGCSHLRVNGVIVASQGDVCRDHSLSNKKLEGEPLCWDEQSLNIAADRINSSNPDLEKERYRLGLSNVLKHVEVASRGMSHLSSVCAIAHKALDPNWIPEK